MKNITLSADEALIDIVRKRAEAKGTTLNSEFRVWLQSQAESGQEQAKAYRTLINQFSHVNAGRRFSRDEMNER